MGIKVGIDLGTTFSAVAMLDEKTGRPVIIPNTLGERITPSVIQFTEDDEIIVGEEAKEAFESGEYGCASVFKRSMGKDETYCTIYDKDYSPEDLSAILLQYLKEEAEAVTGQKIDEAVVTVPAYFYHKERQATMRAAKKAGLKIRQIINEPTAAAITYGANHWRENAVVLVYDLGGGTFDVTLVQMKKNNQMESLQTLGNHTLGGKDWDARICSIIENKIEEETGLDLSEYPDIHALVWQNCESIKKQLTNRTSASVNLKLPDYGRFSTSITLEEFESNTRDLIEKTGLLCLNLLKGLNLGWKDITDILLVGGSTKMKQVSNYLKEISGHTPLSHVNPDEAVALGAAVQVHLPLPEYTIISVASSNASSEKKEQTYNFRKPRNTSANTVVGKEMKLQNVLAISNVDVVAHAMGIIAVSADGQNYINKTIIPANQKIPVKCAEAFHYYTNSRENELEIYVLQGTDTPLNCNIIGKYTVTGIKHDPADNPTTIKIQYSYDVNGMVNVQARQGNNNFDLPIKEEPVPEDMSKFGRPVEKEESSVSETLSVAMAIDVSGSMSGEPLDDAKKAMIHFVDQFESYQTEVKIGIIAVSDKSLIVQNLTSDLSACKRAINKIESCMTGICNDFHPFFDMKKMFRNEVGKCIGIVLADGMWSYADKAIEAAKECHRENIDITAIGFGSADKDFLNKISSGDIDAMLVNQSELTQSFGKIAQEIGGTSSKSGRTGEETTVTTWLALDE